MRWNSKGGVRGPTCHALGRKWPRRLRMKSPMQFRFDFRFDRSGEWRGQVGAQAWRSGLSRRSLPRWPQSVSSTGRPWRRPRRRCRWCSRRCRFGWTWPATPPRRLPRRPAAPVCWCRRRPKTWPSTGTRSAWTWNRTCT